MKIHLLDLMITFKKEREKITFTDFNYFYGQMGAGKSSIARLIDYCLGGDGDLVSTPALQSEFVSVSLSLEIANSALVLSRDANANKIRAQWSKNKELFEVLIPARGPAGEVIPDTGIEVISDLLFHLAGSNPPKVRRSKIKDEADLERLSLRDLLWYCYLDQETIDSSFFNLDSEANTFKRLKSRDVLRFLVGFHQEQVAELEARFEHIRGERLRCEAGAAAIRDALTSAELATELELADVRHRLEADIKTATMEIAGIRHRTKLLRSHTMNDLQATARHLGQQLGALNQANDDIREIIAKDKTHKNELLSLSTRFRRSQSARAVLAGVEFKDCPRCGQLLQTRPQDSCTVCGQSHSTSPTGAIDEQSAEQDLDARIRELSELISRHETQLGKFTRKASELSEEKSIVDAELVQVSVDYD